MTLTVPLLMIRWPQVVAAGGGSDRVNEIFENKRRTDEIINELCADRDTGFDGDVDGDNGEFDADDPGTPGTSPGSPSPGSPSPGGTSSGGTSPGKGTGTPPAKAPRTSANGGTKDKRRRKSKVKGPVHFKMHNHGGLVTKVADVASTEVECAGAVRRLDYANPQHRERLHRDIDGGLLTAAVLKACPVFEDGAMPFHVELTDRVSVRCVACQRTLKMAHVDFDDDGQIKGNRNIFNNFTSSHLTGQNSGHHAAMRNHRGWNTPQKVPSNVQTSSAAQSDERVLPSKVVGPAPAPRVLSEDPVLAKIREMLPEGTDVSALAVSWLPRAVVLCKGCNTQFQTTGNYWLRVQRHLESDNAKAGRVCAGKVAALAKQKARFFKALTAVE